MSGVNILKGWAAPTSENEVLSSLIILVLHC